MKKILAALALAGSVILVGSMPATAVTPATYPAPAVQGTVSTASPAAGEPTTFSGGGMTPGETVEVTATPTDEPQAMGSSFSGGASMTVPAKITLPLAVLTFVTTARADGTFAIPISIPTDGTYTLTARGLTSGHTVTATITVVPSGGGTTTNNGGGTTTNNGGGTTTNNGGGTTTNGDNPAPNNDGSPATNNGDNTVTDADPLAPMRTWLLVGAAALAAGVASVVAVRRRAKAGSTE